MSSELPDPCSFNPDSDSTLTRHPVVSSLELAAMQLPFGAGALVGACTPVSSRRFLSSSRPPAQVKPCALWRLYGPPPQYMNEIVPFLDASSNDTRIVQEGLARWKEWGRWNSEMNAAEAWQRSGGLSKTITQTFFTSVLGCAA